MSNLTVKQIKTIRQLYPTVTSTVGIQCFDADGNEIVVDMSVVDASIKSKQYQRDRAAAYPSYADQFDLLYHGGYDAWKSAIDAIKQEYPKP